MNSLSVINNLAWGTEHGELRTMASKFDGGGGWEGMGMEAMAKPEPQKESISRRRGSKATRRHSVWDE